MSKKDTLYYELSDFYHIYSSKKNYKKESDFLFYLIKKHNNNAVKILDIGCGEGDHLNYLKNEFQCFGIDKSKFQIDKAKRKYSNIKFKSVDVVNEKIEGRYDIITILWNTLLYLSPIDNLVKVIRNIKLNLKEGGILIFDFRSFQKHIDNNNFKLELERELKNKNYTMNLFTRNLIDKDKGVLIEKTNSNIYKDNKLIKKINHNTIELNILDLKTIKGILEKEGYTIEEILDADSLYENKIIVASGEVYSYLIIAKHSIKN